jgi:hypothetical protein
MVQVEQTNEPAQKPQVAEPVVQDATQSVCSLECMPSLLIANIILKSRMNREVHVRFCEEQGVKVPLLTRLCPRASVSVIQLAYLVIGLSIQQEFYCLSFSRMSNRLLFFCHYLHLEFLQELHNSDC